jgi:hypothetical protein
MTIKVSDERKGVVNYANSNILDCIKFWNREGEDVYKKNKSGYLGSLETNAMALKMSYDDFVLEMLLIDCKIFVNSKWATESKIKFECGRTRSHVWYHENNDRKLMIFVQKDLVVSM